MMRRQDQHSKLFYELSVMILNILRSPPTPIQFSDHSPAIHTPPPVSSSRRPLPPAQSMSPAGFASLLLGISLALMLCGSVTFFIGFMLMPWVIGLVMFLYVVGIVSTLSMLGRAILCHTMSPPRKEVPGQMKGGVINSICRYCMGSIAKCCMSAHWHGNSCDGRSELVRAHVGGFSSTIVLFLGGVLPLAM
ncbi:unnamed protein product [Camellia sinensis]